MLVSDTPDGLAVRFVTLEQGVYGVGPGLGDDELIAQHVFRRIEPLASSRLVIANDFVTDLPEQLWDGDEQTAADAPRRPRARRARPAARTVPDRGDPRQRAICARCELLYGIGGLSYGNVSARYTRRRPAGVPDPDGPVYWMSASGVDKADLRARR